VRAADGDETSSSLRDKANVINTNERAPRLL
jgi:hypothetical protein